MTRSNQQNPNAFETMLHRQRQRDQQELATLNEFEATLTQAAPARHDLYSKAAKAVVEAQTIQQLQERLRDTPEFRYAGSIMARGCGHPVKPGTVRKVKVHFQPKSTAKKARFSAV